MDIKAIERAIDKALTMSTKARRALLAGYLIVIDDVHTSTHRSSSRTSLAGLRLTDDEYEKVVGAAAIEPGGVWLLGYNFNGDPRGCQDCTRACYSDDDAITGCDWIPELPKSKVKHKYETPKQHSVRKAEAERWWDKWKHIWPSAWLAYCRERNAVNDDGTIDTGAIYIQCSMFEPFDEDEEWI